MNRLKIDWKLFNLACTLAPSKFDTNLSEEICEINDSADAPEMVEAGSG